MSTTVIEKVTVQELSRYGFKANNEYINWSKNFKDADKTPVVPGASFDMELFVSDSGKKYVNKVLGSSTNVASPTAVVKKTFAPKTAVTTHVPTGSNKASETMSKDEWAAKDQRISRQGMYQACVQALAPLVALELVHAEAVKLANKGLDFVNGK